MRVFLLYHGRFPSEKAASLFAAEEAAGFAKIGVETVLVVPRRLGRVREAPTTYYALESVVRTVFLPTVDLFWIPHMGRIAQDVSALAFSLAALIFLALRAKKDDWIISNEPLPLLFASLRFRNTIYEVHDFPEKKSALFALVFRRVRRILATNRWKAAELSKRYGIRRERMFVELNAVDVSAFDVSLTRDDARRRLSLPLGERLVVYTGHLYSWKGVDTLIEAARLLPDVSVYLVGGTEYHLRAYREKYGMIRNLHIVGHRPHDEMPAWQRAADLLVLPNTAKEEISARYTSPMKLFEYMASGTPIVASDIPSISEIAKGRAILVTPDNPGSLAAGITRVLTDGAEREMDAARAWVKDHTWIRRAERIANHLKNAAH